MPIEGFILVRHAMPELDPQVPPEEWLLGERGRAAARHLAGVLPAGAYLVASQEPKAVETLRQAAHADADADGPVDVVLERGFGTASEPP